MSDSNHPRPRSVVLTVKELADYLSVHPSTIYRMLAKKELPSFKIGSDWRFHREAIDNWIRSKSNS